MEDMARGCRAKGIKKTNHLQNGEIGLHSDAILVIRLPDSQVLRVLSRSLFLAMVILALPYIGSVWRGFSSISYVDVSSYGFGSNLIDVEFLDLILQDLANEGLIKKGNTAVIISPKSGAVIVSARFLNANEIDLLSESDLELANATFDFAFALDLEDISFVDHVVKVGGIVVTQLRNKLSSTFRTQSNYRVVYLRQYDSTIVAMRKTNLVNVSVDSLAKRRLFSLALEAKKVALQGLEDVLLEPPRKALAKSRKIWKKFNYLPDLLGNSLEDYPRRIFIDVGLQEKKSGVMAWFNQSYPTRNQEFELYSIQMVPEGLSNRGAPAVDVSDWLMKNVKEDEFVVMKAEAEVVEDMIKKRTISFVDEMFLECNNQWQIGEKMKSKRAYWECLALYGRLRDEGIAVHQWWD